MKTGLLLLASTLVVTVGTVGCGWEQGSSHYSVSIDPSFSSIQQESIKSALSLWAWDVNDGVRFSLTNNENATIVIIPSSIKKLNEEYDSLEGGVDGYTSYHGTSSTIELAIDLDIPQFYHVAEHELGHAIGLEHRVGGVMQPLEFYHYLITCEDVKAFAQVWGGEAEKMNGCLYPTDITSLGQWSDDMGESGLP